MITLNAGRMKVNWKGPTCTCIAIRNWRIDRQKIFTNYIHVHVHVVLR